MENKVIVGLSGGVDSSVAALLLKEKRFEVEGVTLKLFERDGLVLDEENSCCSKSDIEDAAKICETLGIKHSVLDFGKSFEKNVIDYFISSYIKGETPNPCVVCNRTVKFEELLSAAKDNAFIATGHYAQIGFDKETKRYYIRKGLDEKKDQSYVLYGLSQKFLSRTLFPLGEYSKDKIREIAREANLVSSDKKDSQDICFVPDGNYVNFIEKFTGKKFEKGNFITKDGEVVGKHNGIIGYTIGQRKGLGIASTEPFYVLSKDVENNTVILGRNNDLYSKTFSVRDINYMPFETLSSPIKLKVRTRYKQKEQTATVFPTGSNSAVVEFDETQRAITPGQSAVFYDGDIVIGGGIIN